MASLSEKFRELEEQNPKFARARRQRRQRAGLLRALMARRSTLRMTQQEIAEQMETTQSAVSDLENFVVDPRLSTLQRYADALGAELDIRIGPRHEAAFEYTVAIGADWVAAAAIDSLLPSAFSAEATTRYLMRNLTTATPSDSPINFSDIGMLSSGSAFGFGHVYVSEPADSEAVMSRASNELALPT